MTAPQLPEDELRYIADNADEPQRSIAAELLAARETIERVTKDRDAARAIIDEAKGALPAGSQGPGIVGGILHVVDQRDAARAELAALHARIEQSHNGYQETGKSLGMERPASHLIALGELLTEQVELADFVVRIERDEARAELEQWPNQIAAALSTTVRDDRSPSTWAGHVRREHEAHTACSDRLTKARAEVERLREENDDLRRANGAMCVCKEALDKEVERLTAMHGVERRLAESAEARVAMLQAEVERVAKQRDELIGLAMKMMEPIETMRVTRGAFGVGYDQVPDAICRLIGFAKSLVDAIAAEQPKPADLNLPFYGIDHTGKVVKVSEQPKPVAWPHLPEVDRPASEVQP